MSRIIDEARKAAGLPPQTDEEKALVEAETERIRVRGRQMMSTGCGLTVVALLFLILVAIL